MPVQKMNSRRRGRIFPAREGTYSLLINQGRFTLSLKKPFKVQRSGLKVETYPTD
jgi:hypothetical protein